MENDAYYFHNVKATILFSYNLKSGFDLLRVKGNGFSFYHNPETGRVWRTSSYFPISVIRNQKPWGHFDIRRQKLHIITRGDFENQLDAFVSVLKPHLPDLTIEDIKIKYIEVCSRYYDQYFKAVSDCIKKAETRFFTTVHADGEDKRIKGKTWLTIGKELFIDKNILNIKTYRFIENFRQRKRTISESILPKIEVQIYKPKSLEEAKQEAVSIIKAFQKYIGFETEPMNNEPDYALIQDASLFTHNEKLFNCLKENISTKAVKYPKEITKDELTHKVACYITPEAKSSQEILSYAHTSRSTLQRVLNKLKPYLEKRGTNGTGLYYQIDTFSIEQTQLNNKDKDSCITDISNSNKSKNRGSTPVIDISAGKSGVYHPRIEVIEQKPKFRKVRIIVEKQVVKPKTVKITVLPQTVDFHHLSVKRNSS